MGTSLTQYEGNTALSQWREPEEVLAQAQKAAVALKKVLDLKPNKVMFNNEQYLEREDWGTVGAFFGCTAKSIETRFVDYGTGGQGFEAVAIVIDRNGNEVGRAESMTLNSEETWGEVTKYEWRDKLDENGKKIWNPNARKGKGGYESEKVAVGTSQKPLFQLRSMAQTRAEAKALKSVFGWVVVLAGYRPTPAEELTGHEDFGQPEKTPVQQPQRASAKQAPAKEEDTKTSAPAASAPQTTTGSATGGSAAANNAREISGVIDGVRQVGSKVWLTVKGHSLLVSVGEDHVDGDMVVGAFIKLRAQLSAHKNLATAQNPNGDFWAFGTLIELNAPKQPEAQTSTAPSSQPLSAEMAETADELFGEGTSNKTIEGMKESGQVTSASSLPEGKTPGTIGRKRAQRLYTIAGQNVKTTGFTEENIHKVLKAMYPANAEQHLRDLETSRADWFEGLCLGKEDWREYVSE